MTYVREGEDKVRLPTKPIDQNRSDHHDEEIPRPMRRDADGCSASSCFKREDLRTIHPRHDIDRRAEYQHVREEEGDRGAGAVLPAETE